MKLKDEDYIEYVEDVSNYKLLPNNILVLQLNDNTIKKIGDKEIHFPTHVRHGKVASRYSVRYGKVITVCDKFVEKKSGKGQTRWVTEIEVLPGDIVWCEHTAFLNSERITDGENIYYIVDYQNLVVAERDLKMIMLNGRVLLEMVKKEQSQILITERKETSEGVILHNGTNNKSYTHSIFEDADVKEGDRVYLKPGSYHKLEDDLWYVLDKNLYYAQKKDIIAKST